MKRFVFYCNNLPDMSAMSISHLNSNTYQQHFSHTHTHTHTLYHLFESLPVILCQSTEIRSMAEIDAVSMATISVFRSGQGVMVTRRAPLTRHLQPKSRQLSSCTNITETRSVCVRVCVCVCVCWSLIGRTFCQSWSKKGGHTWLHPLDWQAQGTNHIARRASDHLENNSLSFLLSAGELQLLKLFSLYISLTGAKLLSLSSIYHPVPPYILPPYG